MWNYKLYINGWYGISFCPICVLLNVSNTQFKFLNNCVITVSTEFPLGDIYIYIYIYVIYIYMYIYIYHVHIYIYVYTCI